MQILFIFCIGNADSIYFLHWQCKFFFFCIGNAIFFYFWHWECNLFLFFAWSMHSLFNFCMGNANGFFCMSNANSFSSKAHAPAGLQLAGKGTKQCKWRVRVALFQEATTKKITHTKSCLMTRVILRYFASISMAHKMI